MRAILNITRERRGVLPFRTVAIVGACALVLAGCGRAGGGSDPDVDGPRVVVSFYPLAEAVERIGGGDVVVTNLTPPGVEPHDLEVAPSDIEAIATADLVLYAGGGFQPSVEEAIGEASGRTLDVLEGRATLPPTDTHGHDDHAEDAEHGEGEHADDDSHGGDADHDAEAGLRADPHVWLDPTLYAEIVDDIVDVLSAVDPARAETYAANGDAFVEELTALDRRFRSGLATCESRLLVVNHAAFGYLAAAYDLEQEAISGVSPETEPTPERLAELRDEVRAEGVTTIFTEELVSPAVAETLAAEASVSTAVLNPIEGLTAEQQEAGEDYGSLMRATLDALIDGLRCG